MSSTEKMKRGNTFTKITMCLSNTWCIDTHNPREAENFTFVFRSLRTSPTVLCLGSLIVWMVTWWARRERKTFINTSRKKSKKSKVYYSPINSLHLLSHGGKQLSMFSNLAILAMVCPELHSIVCQKSARLGAKSKQAWVHKIMQWWYIQNRIPVLGYSGPACPTNDPHRGT